MTPALAEATAVDQMAEQQPAESDEGQLTVVSAVSDEIEIALKAVLKTSKLFDLDLHLRDKPEEFNELAEETKALLREANYSDEVLAKYDAWAAAEAAKTIAAAI